MAAAPEPSNSVNGTGLAAAGPSETEQNNTNGNAPDRQDGVEGLLSLTIVLPDGKPNIQLTISPHEQVHEIRQSIIDLPTAYPYTCFHLEYDGSRVNDFVPLSEVPGMGSEAEFRVVLDPYTEKEARIHVIRIRELIGAAGNRTDTANGVLHGLSILDEIADYAQNNSGLDVVKEYNFSTPATLSTLLPRPVDPAPKTIKGLALSPWNPPPFHLRQKGHLLYLTVTTNEGEQHQVTAHAGGFFLNKSSNIKFDPSPRPPPKGQSAHSLLSLIELVSPAFASAFGALQEYNNRRDPLSTFQVTHALPSSPWAVPSPESPICAHIPDTARSQESYLIAGVENADTLRDWNEEIQSARELPKDTIQDRLFRERLMSKVIADYIDAATRGAVLVARGEVAPLNPTECDDAQIFVYNNVFFSFGVDGVGTFTSEGGDEAARVATGKDVAGVRLVNQLDIEGLYTPGTVVVDYLGKRIVGQSIVPGIFKQRQPGETQIDYGAVDGRDVVASDVRFVSVFERMSRALRVKRHAVWDKDGKRIELEASVETKGLLGTDSRKYALDLYRITPLDIGWLDECAAQVSTEGATGYPHRMAVLRPELVESFARYKALKEEVLAMKQKASQLKDGDAEKSGSEPAGSNVDVREDDTATSLPELAKEASASHSGGVSAEKPKSGELGAETPTAVDLRVTNPNVEAGITNGNLCGTSAKTSIPKPPIFALNADVYSGQIPQTKVEREELRLDEQEVREVCDYLRDKVIPDLIRDLRESDTSFPMDGPSLARMLHKRGINVRYIGRIASLSEDSKLSCLRFVCTQDMIARAFKHIASSHLRTVPAPLSSACVCHLLNCLLGWELNSDPQSQTNASMKALYSDVDWSFEKLTPDSLRQSITEQVACRFRYRLETSWHTAIKPLQMLRQVSLELGIQLQARDYVFSPLETTPSSPVEGADKELSRPFGAEVKRRKKKSHDSSPVSTPTGTLITFMSDDIVNMVPVVKHSAPRSTLAEEVLEAGRLSLLQDQRKIGQELLLESLSLHEQIYGILHPDVARAYTSLSSLYYQLDDKEAAVELARKAVVVSERTMGLDSAETLLAYLNLSLFLHQAGDSKNALLYSKHALELWKIIYGPGHPDSITTINNAAVMLQSLKAFHESRLWFEESLRICEIVYGKQSINAATLLFQLAQAMALDSDHKGAVRRMRESYAIFLNELGAADRNTKEAEHWLEQLTQNAVSIAKLDKEQAARRIRAGICFSNGTTSLPNPRAPEFSSAADGTRTTPTPSPMDPRSIDELIKFIEGTDQQSMPSKTGGRHPGRGNPKSRGKSALIHPI